MMALLLAVRACLPVEGDRITVGDLAAVIPAFLGLNQKEPIGFGPAPGATRRFSPGELDRLAARKGIAVASGPVCFEREMETLTRDRVVAALRESLPEGSQMELIEFSQARIPKGILEFPRGGLTPARTGSPRQAVIWRGRLKYAASQSVTVWAKTRAWISRPSIVAAQDLPAHAPISVHQIRIESVDSSPFSSSAAVSLGDIAGLLPRRRILSGQVISRSALAAPTEVSRGEMVAVEAHYRAASLRFEARAELAGRVGDLIPVRNMESRKTFRARVVRKGFVEVE
jgi:flagella basal body P-ring formation protein FlgA